MQGRTMQDAMGAERARTLAFLVLAVLVVTLVGVLWATPAHAADTFTVDRSDDPDLATTPAAGACTQATTNDCSLRGAINTANANDNQPTVDFIDFAIPGAGPHTISPASDLPPITEAVTINGYSESLDEGTNPAKANTLAVGNNAVLKIELDGTNAHNGLRIQAANSTVKGLIINRFSNPSVWLQSAATGNKVEGNYIGTDAAGTAVLGNIYGVDIEGSNNTVGGTEPGARNIISGNVIGVAIFLSGATGNQVMGNYIGTDKDGDDDLGNTLGVLINGASNNTIGGTDAGDGEVDGVVKARNVISGNVSSQTFGNDGDGVRITSADSTGNKVEGNYIGTGASGTQPLSNSGDGVRIDSSASKNTVGGTEAGAGNIISGNVGNGVEVSYWRNANNSEENDPTPATGNRILSNSIYDNDALGIDLVIPPNQLPGVTNNDGRDRDTGPNNLQNFPVLSS